MLLALLLVSACASHKGIVIPKNEYGLEVVTTGDLYSELVALDPSKEMVDLSATAPQVRVEVRYATDQNFMKQQLYPYAAALVRRPVATALIAVAEDLRTQGLGIKVWDAYRPYSVTRKMWEPYKNPDFVADPAKGSRHNRGAAVDLTLVDLRTGRELPMPTGHDDFTARASWAFTDLPADVLHNRQTLRDAMERHGFTALPSEWWHFDFAGWERFELMDVPFDALF